MALSLSALDTWWLVGGLCLPAGLDPECWLEQKSLPGPPDNLSLAETEPRKERVQDTTIVSFLEMPPDFLVRLPQTQ